MRPYPLEQLGAFCKKHPLRSKVVFVPSSQIGYNLTTALAASGQSWANLHVTTPAGWAIRSLEEWLQAEDWQPLAQDIELFYLEEMLESAVSGGTGHYFAGLSISPGLTRSFLRTLQSLRNAGITAEELAKTSVEPGKTRLLAALFREYHTRQETERYYDEAYVFSRAITTLTRENRTKDDTVYAILDETLLPGQAFQYIKALTENALYRIGRADYGCIPPAHTAAARFPDAPFPQTESAKMGIGGKLLSEGLVPADSEDFRLQRTLGTENEVRGILREILHKELSLDTIEIAYTTESPYLSLLHDATERFEIPVAFAEGIPVMLTRPGQALAGFFRWMGSGFDAAELVELCRAGLITFDRIAGSDESLPPYQVAMMLLQGRVGQGRDSYARGFDRLQEGLRQRIEALGEEDRITQHLEVEQAGLLSARRMVDELLALIPKGAKIPISALTEASVQFLLQFASVQNVRDKTAQDSLVVRLQEIGAHVKVEGLVMRLVPTLSQLITEHKIEASAALPGHLYVVPLSRAGYTNREHLYIIGMDESAFPGGATEDPILLDEERSQLSGELALQRIRPGEQVWQLIRALGMSVGKVTLLANCRSTVDGRETYPSPLFYQAADQLTQGKPEKVSIIPSVPASEEALDDVEAMLAARKGAGFAEEVPTVFPWLGGGEAAAQIRQAPRLTRFDGWLETDTPDLDIADGQTVLSASRLETLTTCPYCYFIRYVLRVEPPEESEVDPTRWLSPLEFGSLLHDLFCDFMKALQAREEPPHQERHAELIVEMLEAEIEKTRERIPVLYEAAFRADRQRLVQAARIFLAVESRRQEVEPVGFEVSFGFGETGGLNSPRPVKLRLSDRMQLTLRGRIDRVDRVPDGYEIWDYKTGSMRPYDEKDLLKQGAHLQWALYAHVLENILRERGESGRVLRSGYFFTSERENGRRLSDEPPALNRLADLLEPLFKLAAQGCFFHVIKGDPCTYCDYKRLCDSEPCLGKDIQYIQEAMADQSEIMENLSRWTSG